MNLMLFNFWKVIMLIPTIHTHKNVDFSKIAFAFSVTPCKKSVCGRPHPDVMFQIIKYTLFL